MATMATAASSAGAAASSAGSRRRRDREKGDGGLGVVRIKPLGAGGGGGEASASRGDSGKISYDVGEANIRVDGRSFTYPSHVISPEMDQQALYDGFMPPRVAQFMGGGNVNVICYGQTGSGKTHTVFGPPGIMSRAASGQLGGDCEVCPDYGLFPRALLDCFQQARARRAAGEKVVLTASAVELSMLGNEDMMARDDGPAMARRRAAAKAASGTDRWGGGLLGVVLDKAAEPPRLYGMIEHALEDSADLRTVFRALATRNTAG